MSIEELQNLKTLRSALSAYIRKMDIQLISIEKYPEQYAELKAAYEAEYRRAAKLVFQFDSQIRTQESMLKIAC